MQVWIGYTSAQSTSEAEAFATAQTLKLAEEIQMFKLEIEDNAQDVILALREDTHKLKI